MAAGRQRSTVRPLPVHPDRIRIDRGIVFLCPPGFNRVKYFAVISYRFGPFHALNGLLSTLGRQSETAR